MSRRNAYFAQNPLVPTSPTSHPQVQTSSPLVLTSSVRQLDGDWSLVRRLGGWSLLQQLSGGNGCYA